MLTYTPLDGDHVARLKRVDDHGNTPERALSGGTGTPCRHCLCDVPEGEEMLILSLRPFPDLHPYAEQGPIFLCAADCAAHDPRRVPPVLTTSPDYLVKGYTSADRILYGSGGIVPAHEIADYATRLFTNPDIAYIHVRSARNNCYLCRIDRDAPEP
ncbi:hypothetical protein FHS89_002436 [Rubricella aquisinus]|uniref:DUF1203 domain-containing protein n=1 Tax=Rubricella aquisinus TaxID=2028108 RepID=A0A840X3J3_9RHOB|nr:DUF1203 domain-containing protein [Rubricella aquisinus]MBB5516405.1 hypothetical protein [Rubricella aquisinus]